MTETEKGSCLTHSTGDTFGYSDGMRDWAN